MSVENETNNSETPPGETQTSLATSTATVEGKTAEEVAAEAEAARVAALTPEEKEAEAAKAEEARRAALTDEERAAEDAAKAREEAMKAPVTAESIKIPEGFEVPEGGLQPLLDVMNNAELTPAERTQELVNLHTSALKAASEAGSKAWEETQETWQKEVKADPTVGGANLEKSLSTVGKLIDQFGSKDLRDVFDLTGAGNNVHMIKFLAAIGDKLTEGGPVQGMPTSTVEDQARRLYPTMKA